MVWLDDGSNSVLSIPVAVCNPVQDAPKYNALYQDGAADKGISSGAHAFRFNIVNGDGVWLGLSTKKAFTTGWKLKGMFYGGPGNTSNGSAGCITSYGPRIQKGDVIDVRVDFIQDDSVAKVAVVFFHNGNCLAEAFRVPAPPNAAPLFPCISLKESTDAVSVQKLDSLPEIVPPTQPSYHDIMGPWQLLDYTSLETESDEQPPPSLPVPADLHPVMDISSTQPDTLDIHIKVANSIMGKLARAHDNYTTVGAFACTRLMPIGPAADIEAFLIKVFATTVSIHTDPQDQNKLILEDDAGRVANWARHIPKPNPPYSNDIF